MEAAHTAVLLVGHGTVSELSDVPEFLSRIRHGRAPEPALVAEIQRRYAHIGGSPLLAICERLSRALEERVGVRTFLGMRFWRPSLPEVLAKVRAADIQKLCILPLAPYSVPLYVDVVVRASADLSGQGPELVAVESYGADRTLVAAHAAAIAKVLSGKERTGTELVLTAHSLPVQVISQGDMYQKEFVVSARAIERELGWPAQIAYQSAGQGGGEWLGPTLAAALKAARERGKSSVVVAPVGFLADHVETLYDLDVEAAALAKDLGLSFARVPALNDSPDLVESLAALVRRTLK